MPNKFKPTKFPITEQLVRSGEYGWAILSGVFEFAFATDEANQGLEVWSCGNCRSPINLRHYTIPNVCSKCGAEIDWLGIKTRLICYCPRCNLPARLGDKYCERCLPPVKLVGKEVPLS